MLLGYAVGAIGVYGVLFRYAPIRSETRSTHASPGATDVIELFEGDESRRAA